jgi:hypothetical protein
MKENVACLGDMLRNASGLSIQEMKHTNTEPMLTQHFITAEVIARVCHISTFSRRGIKTKELCVSNMKEVLSVSDERKRGLSWRYTEPMLTQHFITAKVIARVCYISTFSRRGIKTKELCVSNVREVLSV